MFGIFLEFFERFIFVVIEPFLESPEAMLAIHGDRVNAVGIPAQTGEPLRGGGKLDTAKDDGFLVLKTGIIIASAIAK